MSTIPLTRRGSEKLKEELQRLKSVERHAVIQAIAEARAQGDLSENAEYEAAKDKQGFIEGRILEIEGKLAAAQVIDPATLDAEGRVVFGATVELEDEASGTRVTYQIVGDDEADLKLGLISISSPIARALIGKEAGDVAEVQAPGGAEELRDHRGALPLMLWRVRRMLPALWAGLLLCIAAIAAPAAFADLASADAGRVVGCSFAREAWLSLAAGGAVAGAGCAAARHGRAGLERAAARGAPWSARCWATLRCSR